MAAGRASNEPLTVYVKNLSFATTEAGLKGCFEKAGLRVRSVSIPRKKGQGASEAMLSTGFGFVECADQDLVVKALKVGTHSNAHHAHYVTMSTSTVVLCLVRLLSRGGWRRREGNQ